MRDDVRSGAGEPAGSAIAFRQYTAHDQVTPALRQALVESWVEVSDAGGAAGFPFPPIDASHAGPALGHILAALAPDLAVYPVFRSSPPRPGRNSRPARCMRNVLHPTAAHR